MVRDQGKGKVDHGPGRATKHAPKPLQHGKGYIAMKRPKAHGAA
jgi:hypothetical protein